MWLRQMSFWIPLASTTSFLSQKRECFKCFAICMCFRSCTYDVGWIFICSDTGRKVEEPELLEAIRLTIINNMIQYHPV